MKYLRSFNESINKLYREITSDETNKTKNVPFTSRNIAFVKSQIRRLTIKTDILTNGAYEAFHQIHVSVVGSLPNDGLYHLRDITIFKTTDDYYKLYVQLIETYVPGERRVAVKKKNLIYLCDNDEGLEQFISDRIGVNPFI